MFKKKINSMKNFNSDNNRHESSHYKKNHYTEEIHSHIDRKPCCLSNKGNPLIQEFLCHLPMSILALSISLFFLILLDGFFSQISALKIKQVIYLNLFHIAHYVHILFSSFASFYSFSYLLTSKMKLIFASVLSILNSFIFCTLADIILPTIGGFFLDNNIDFHFCFLHLDDIINALLFAIFGLLAAYCLINGNKQYAEAIARKVHLGHVWFGCIAALFYLFAEIQVNVILNSSFLFLILFFSVVIPCIFSDICTPYLFNRCTDRSNIYKGIKIEYN